MKKLFLVSTIFLSNIVSAAGIDFMAAARGEQMAQEMNQRDAQMEMQRRNFELQQQQANQRLILNQLKLIEAQKKSNAKLNSSIKKTPIGSLAGLAKVCKLGANGEYLSEGLCIGYIIAVVNYKNIEFLQSDNAKKRACASLQKVGDPYSIANKIVAIYDSPTAIDATGYIAHRDDFLSPIVIQSVMETCYCGTPQLPAIDVAVCRVN